MSSYWNKSKGESLEYRWYLLLTGFDFYLHVYLAVLSPCHLMIFRKAAKVKMIAQASSVASASVAVNMLISEWAPCCRGALLEGSYCYCSNWNFAHTAFVCGGGVGNTTQKAGLCLLLGTCQGIWEDSKKGFAVLPACFWCLVLSCVPQMWDTSFPSMLSDRKKKAYVWRMEYSLNHTFCDSESWALNYIIVEEFRSFGIFLKQKCKLLWYL